MLDPNYLQDFKEFDYRDELIPVEIAEQETFFANLSKRFAEELLRHEKLQDFLNQFRGNNDPEKFAAEYAQQKVNLVRYYKYYVRLMNEEEIEETEYQKSAHDALEALLQKKLFNLEQQWRANRLKLDELKISEEFNRWSRDIFSCPFIPPVIDYELDLLKRFLRESTDRYENIADVSRQYSYQEVREKDENGDYPNMPEWFKFYDTYMGTGNLLLLPDIRGPQEERYIDRFREEKSKGKPPVPAPTPVEPDKRPFIFNMGHEYAACARLVETDTCIRYLFEAYDRNKYREANRPDHFELDYALDKLQKADRPIRFDSKLIWHEAIFTAVYRYENERTAEHLDHVFAEYQMIHELGMQQDNSDDMLVQMYQNELIPKLREAVLVGRKLLGEPEDFDF